VITFEGIVQILPFAYAALRCSIGMRRRCCGD
jgi:hypothetical protein